ncbi:hypothetical protein C5167_032364 [Papaver somniferum]|uniref:Uncharacterized protein n=1 Tax=Papaver somniferum TaxID=3469 RepID=A0A4Y7K8X3_PAPSO|nr:light-harvesting complex-like protein 3 isotype 1, chloroplastic [Papaver somniferum]RZC69256.1 hypothetical protein C5167_032364 [Papaver somniferum]
MVSIAITSSSLQITSSSHRFTKKRQSLARPRCTLATEQKTHVVTVNVENKSAAKLLDPQEKKLFRENGSAGNTQEPAQEIENESTVPRFHDERWEKGTWDLNCFVKNGKMDWDGVILAEARRRKFLEMYPETATNEEPVVFLSSIIPWWAWIRRSHLPEAELLNGRAAMVGFFMAYTVDVLTGLDMVGQAGNFVCKTGLLITLIGIMAFRKKEDFGNLQKLADEATYYDKQWRASWEEQNSSPSSKKR